MVLLEFSTKPKCCDQRCHSCFICKTSSTGPVKVRSSMKVLRVTSGNLAHKSRVGATRMHSIARILQLSPCGILVPTVNFWGRRQLSRNNHLSWLLQTSCQIPRIFLSIPSWFKIAQASLGWTWSKASLKLREMTWLEKSSSNNAPQTSAPFFPATASLGSQLLIHFWVGPCRNLLEDQARYQILSTEMGRKSRHSVASDFLGIWDCLIQYHCRILPFFQKDGTK